MELPATDRYCREISKDRASPISKKYLDISMIYFDGAEASGLRHRFLFCPAARFAVRDREKRDWAGGYASDCDCLSPRRPILKSSFSAARSKAL
jgi:hypothetical protein